MLCYTEKNTKHLQVEPGHYKLCALVSSDVEKVKVN